MLGSLKPKKLKAAVYIRVSTSKQAKDGNGLESQLTKCKAIITVKDWELYKIYGNLDGISGSVESKDRKYLSEMIKDAKKGLFDCIVFNSLDRLGRSTKIILEVIETFTETGVKIVSCKELIDTSTASGELMLTFFAGIAQYEKRVILERMHSGREVTTKKYGENGGLVPLGYIRDVGGKILIHPKESAIVSNIFMARSKGMTLRQIADSLNSFNIKTRRGKKWHPSSVNYILKNLDKYEGCERKGNVNGVCWPKILHYD